MTQYQRLEAVPHWKCGSI